MMDELELDEMRSIVSKLNEASDAYYNGKGEIMSDFEWDALFDRLKKMEAETGTVLPDSPTNKVSADMTEGEKEAHEFSALSLAKTKKPEDLVKWAEGKPIWISWKLDGLTLVVTYDNGKLTKVVTRGDGHIGTNITRLAKAINGIPQCVSDRGHLVIRGEAVISYEDFMASFQKFILWCKKAEQVKEISVTECDKFHIIVFKNDCPLTVYDEQEVLHRLNYGTIIG